MSDFLMVPVIMICALGGTVGIIKLLQKIFPGGIPRDPLTKKIEDTMKKGGE